MRVCCVRSHVRSVLSCACGCDAFWERTEISELGPLAGGESHGAIRLVSLYFYVDN